MFLKIGGTSGYELYFRLEDVVAFGKYEQATLAQPTVTLNGNVTFKTTTSMSPTFEYWIQLKDLTPERGRITCNELEYQQVVDALAPGGAELYEPELRQHSDNIDPNSGCSGSMAKLEDATRTAAQPNQTSSK